MKISKSELIDKYNDLVKVCTGYQDKEILKKCNYKNARTLCGEAILRYGLNKSHFNLKNVKDLTIKKNEFNKPYIIGEDVFFNISHSKDYIVCSISNAHIGIDMEYIGKIKENALNSFSNDEKSLLFDYSFKEKTELFYVLWTLKESFVKNLGFGFTMDIDGFSLIDVLTFKTNKIMYKNNIYYFYTEKIFGNYIISMCQDGKEIKNKNFILNIDDILV